MKTIVEFARHKPREIFGYFSPARLKEDIVRGIFAGYEAAIDGVRRDSFGAPEAKDLLPHLRRAHIETVFAEIAVRQRAENVEVATGKNRCDNAHRIIKCGPVWITQSKIESRYQMPREAVFRQSYAEKSQLMLFDEHACEEARKTDEEVLYGIVVHKPTSGLLGLAEFIDIVFPDRHCERIVDRIRLCEECEPVVNDLVDGIEVRVKSLMG